MSNILSSSYDSSRDIASGVSDERYPFGGGGEIPSGRNEFSTVALAHAFFPPKRPERQFDPGRR
jgi:hypothetical protein